MERTGEAGPATGATRATGEPALRVARTIASALPLGVLGFWGIGWFLTDGGASGRAAGAIADGLAFQLWAALALGGLAGALYFRGRAIGVAEDAARAGTPGRGFGEVQTYLVIAWALLEAQALLAGVLLLALGLEQVVGYAAAVYLVGLALTWPRAAWYGADASGRWR